MPNNYVLPEAEKQNLIATLEATLPQDVKNQVAQVAQLEAQKKPLEDALANNPVYQQIQTLKNLDDVELEEDEPQAGEEQAE